MSKTDNFNSKPANYLRSAWLHFVYQELIDQFKCKYDLPIACDREVIESIKEL